MSYDAADRDSDEESVPDTMRPLMYDQAAEVEHPDYTVAEVNNNKARTASTSSAQGRGRASLSSASGALSRSTTSTSDAVDLEARAVHSPLVSRVAATPVLSSSPARSASIDRMGNQSKEEWQVFPDDMFALTDNKYTKGELTARTPWKAFFTDPVAQALLVCAFVYVSACPRRFHCAKHFFLLVLFSSSICTL